MKSALRLVTLLVSAAIILVSGSGFAISKMLCIESGKVSYSVEKADDCCAGDDENSLKEKCCDYSSQSIKVDHFIKNDFSFQPAVIATIVPLIFNFFSDLPQSKFVFNKEAPPLLNGRDIRILISVFNI